MNATSAEPAVPLDGVVLTEKLTRRPCRPPDYAAQSDALTSLPGHRAHPRTRSFEGAPPKLGLKTRPLPAGAPEARAGGRAVTQYAVVPTFEPLSERTKEALQVVSERTTIAAVLVFG
jgi:hypothetical protein